MKKIFFLGLILFSLTNLMAQVGIGTETPDTSSLLELSSTTQGFLMPRLTTTQRDAITSPAEGLLIYNLDSKCLQFYTDAAWSACLDFQSDYKTLLYPPTPSVSSFYVAGTALRTSNKLTTKVTTTSAGVYDISTNTVNGYSFSGTGTFPSAGTYDIELQGTGTPISSGTDTFIITMVDSAGGTSSVDVEVLAIAPPIYTSCKEYYDNGFNTDGIYTVDPDGVGVGDDDFDCYCDMTSDGGGWTLVFRHDSSGGFFAGEAEADSFNENLPGLSTDKYSILNKIDEIKSGTDYEFRLFYPENSIRNHWTQTSSPRVYISTPPRVVGYSAISIQSSGNSWGGLERTSSSGNSPAFLDGSVNTGLWWYAIGSNAGFSGDRIPGPSSVVNIVELYIR